MIIGDGSSRGGKDKESLSEKVKKPLSREDLPLYGDEIARYEEKYGELSKEQIEKIMGTWWAYDSEQF